MAEITCVVCGAKKRVPPSQIRAGRKYCSNACAIKAHTGKGNGHWNGGLVELPCLHCGKLFSIKPSHLGKKGQGKYCSDTCRTTASRGDHPERYNRVTKICVVCGKEIQVKKSHIDTEGMYCSKECRNADYAKMFTGENNPNFRGGYGSTCPTCGNPVWIFPYNKKGKKYCSVSCAMIWRAMNEEFDYSGKRRSKSGRREDLDNKYFRSSWEANYARYLNWLIEQGEIAKWEFEAETFRFPVSRGNMTYLPDFKVTNNDGSVEYHEVKGYMDKGSATKLKRMAKYYPDVKMVLVDKPYYQALQKQLRNLISGWESAK